MQHEEVKQAVRTWRNPRRVDLDNHMPNQARNEVASGSGGNPVKLEAAEKSEVDSEATFTPEDDEADAFTVIDSDESEASIFGLRHVLRDAEEDDELSEASSQGEDRMAVTERERVGRWRLENLLLDDLDFAYVFGKFEEAYSYAGRAVAMAWSRARFLAEPEMVTDMVRISEVEATATKIRRVDKRKLAAADKRRRMASAAFLRQPGKGAKVEEENDDKTRFIEPLAQLMADCKVGRDENASATDDEIMNSLRRKARRVVEAAGIPILHGAITTADEVRRYLTDRAMHMAVDKV